MADGPRYYRVSPKFWSSAERLGWDEETRLLALYLLTCDHRSTEGLFRLPKQYILADLEWSAQRLSKPFARLCSDDFIDYDDDAKVMLIVKALAYQSPSNPNGVTAALRALEMVPVTRLDSRFYELSQRYSERLTKALPQRFGEPLTHPPTQTQAQSSTQAPNSVPDGTDADDALFDEFWDAYPVKDGMKGGGAGRKICRKSWDKLTDEERRLARIGVDHYREYVEQPNSPLVAMATTWLNQERWEQFQEPRNTNGQTIQHSWAGTPSGRLDLKEL
jgi:hypothetical protein